MCLPSNFAAPLGLFSDWTILRDLVFYEEYSFHKVV